MIIPTRVPFCYGLQLTDRSMQLSDGSIQRFRRHPRVQVDMMQVKNRWREASKEHHEKADGIGDGLNMVPPSRKRSDRSLVAGAGSAGQTAAVVAKSEAKSEFREEK